MDRFELVGRHDLGVVEPHARLLPRSLQRHGAARAGVAAPSARRRVVAHRARLASRDIPSTVVPVMAASPSYEIGRVPRTVVGASALGDLGALLDALDGTDLIVIADQGVRSDWLHHPAGCRVATAPGHVACRPVGGADHRLGRRCRRDGTHDWRRNRDRRRRRFGSRHRQTGRCGRRWRRAVSSRTCCPRTRCPGDGRSWRFPRHRAPAPR